MDTRSSTLHILIFQGADVWDLGGGVIQHRFGEIDGIWDQRQTVSILLRLALIPIIMPSAFAPLERHSRRHLWLVVW